VVIPGGLKDELEILVPSRRGSWALNLDDRNLSALFRAKVGCHPSHTSHYVTACSYACKVGCHPPLSSCWCWC